MRDKYNIEKLLIKCIEISGQESNKYAKIIGLCNNPEFINILRKSHITKQKHLNMFLQIYKSISEKDFTYTKKEYEIIGDFKNNLKFSLSSSFKNIDIYKELYFIFDESKIEKDMMFEILLDEQIICNQNSYMISTY